VEGNGRDLFKLPFRNLAVVRKTRNKVSYYSDSGPRLQPTTSWL